MKKSSLWLIGAVFSLLVVTFFFSLRPKMRRVEYVVYVTPSSAGHIVIRYEDKSIRPGIDNGNIVATHDLRTMARVVVPTREMNGVPWRKTVELPVGSHAYAEAGEEGGPKHKELAVSIYIDGEFKSSFHGDNVAAMHNSEFID